MARFSVIGRRVRSATIVVIHTQATLDAAFDAALVAAERDPQWVSLYAHDANGTTLEARYLEFRRAEPLE